MELLYIWIENYRCFKKTEFNFSDKFKFCYDPKEVTLTWSKGMNSSLGLWGKHITNLSVIVGDNGAGKTTILKCIIDCISYGGNCIDNNCFFVFLDKESSKIKIFTNGDFIHKLRVSTNLDEFEIFPYSYMISIGDERDRGNSMFELRKNKIIYIQNVLDINDYLHEKRGQIYDFSIGGLIRHDYKNNVEKGHIESSHDKLINFSNNEIYRQLDFVQSYKANNSENIVPFEMPNNLQVSFVDNSYYMKHICEELKKYADTDSENFMKYKRIYHEKVDKLVYMINEKTNKIQRDRKQIWCALMVNNLILNALSKIAVSPTVPGRRDNELFSFFKAYEILNKNENESILSFCSSFFHEVEKDLIRNKSSCNKWLEPYKEFVKWLKENYEIINFDFSEVVSELKNYSYFLISMRQNNREIFEQFFAFYRRTCMSFYYLNFSWGLSSGENNLLSLYARLYSALKSKIDGSRGEEVVNNFPEGETKCNNILVLIDEADLSFHPEWQRSFIHSLILFLPSIFKGCDLQIILTTHSPIILSDVPKGSVIYLKQGENDSDNFHKETFGQNIYTLFDDAFFLKESEEKSVLGKFAEEKIKNVNKFLKSIIEGNSNLSISERNNGMNEAKRIISFIGEPIIKTALQDKLKIASDILQANTRKSEELLELMKKYDILSSEDQKELIKYIIQKEV